MKKIVKIIMLAIAISLGLCACANIKTEDKNRQIISSLDLKYADQFSIDYYEDGYVHIHIEGDGEYVIIPEGEKEDNLGLENVTFIYENPENIYLAATSVIDLFETIDSLDNVMATGKEAKDYTKSSIVEKIEKGEIKNVGKYSAPDYEILVNESCDLAIESTMIYHSPKIKEQLERIGIPVLVERSSYESDPLGRLEWIKLYGVLTGKEDEAVEYFDSQCEIIEALNESVDSTGDRKKVVCFYISSKGYVNVRKPGDYITKMIEIAGGEYALNNIEFEDDNSLSTVNINWEEFYKYAYDADVIIYNSTIDGGMDNLQDLIDRNELFKDFKAVMNHEVWCTTLNMYQESSKIAVITNDFNKILNDSDDVTYLYRLE